MAEGEERELWRHGVNLPAPALGNMRQTPGPDPPGRHG